MNRLVVVVGDIILDQTTKVKVRGVSPENSSVLVANEEHAVFNLGGAANVAHNVKTLGGDVLLLGFNTDKRVDALCDQAKLSYSFANPLAIQGRTPVKNRVITKDGHYLLRLDQEYPFFGMGEAYWHGGNEITRAIEQALWVDKDAPKPVFCLVDYGKGCLPVSAANVIMSRIDKVYEGVKFPVIVDPGRDGQWGKFASRRTIYRANLHQALQHYKANDKDHLRPPFLENEFDHSEVYLNPEVYKGIAGRVMNNLTTLGHHCAYLLLTLGKAGMVLIGRQPHLSEYFTTALSGADSCGAGDVVTATMAAYLAKQENPLEFDAVAHAVDRARRAAFASVIRPGVVTVTPDDAGMSSETRWAGQD